MGVALSGVVDGPRAPDLLHLLLFGFICNPRLLGYLHNHRYVQFTSSLYIHPFLQPPEQIPAVVSSILPHLILRTRVRPRRCMTSQSHPSIMRCTIGGDDKKEICIYCVSTVPSTQCDATEREKTREPNEGAQIDDIKTKI